MRWPCVAIYSTKVGLLDTLNESQVPHVTPLVVFRGVSSRHAVGFV